MAVNSKDIDALWKQFSEEGVNKGISVVQFFESNGVPYHTFEKWYKKMYSREGIVDCVVKGSPDATIQVPDEDGREDSKTEKKKDVYISYVNIGLSNGIKIDHHRLTPADTNNDHLQTSMACQEAIRLFQRRPEVKPIQEFWYMEVPSCTE